MAIINAQNCNKTYLGLGLSDCELYLGEFRSVIAVPKGWSIPVSELVGMDLDYIVGLVQQQTFDPILNAIQFTDNTPDPTTQEYTGGVISVVRNGKPQYQFEFNNGVFFHKALYSRNAFKLYDVLLVDDSGTIVGATTVDGTRFTGLSASMFNTQTFRPKVGDTNPRTLLDIQLDNESQFNTRMALIVTAQSTVDVNTEINPITSVTITGTASAANDITVQVNYASNATKGVEGLVAANFRIRNLTTDAVVAITSVTESTVNKGEYLLEPTVALTATNVIVVEMYDATAIPPVNVALIAPNILYKGESAEMTVSA
jgi:hypothetical protein